MRKLIFMAIFLCSPITLAGECRSIIEASFGHYSTFTIDQDGRNVARLHYLVDHNSAFIADTFVEPEYRKRGYMTLLFSKLIEFHPQVKRIDGNLSLMNRDIMIEQLGYNRLINEAYCKQLVRKTPAYKIRDRLGFSRIYKCIWHLAFIEFGSEK